MKIIRYDKVFQFLNPLTFYSWSNGRKNVKDMREEEKEEEDNLQHKSVKDLVIICFEMFKFIAANTLESQIVDYTPD